MGLKLDGLQELRDALGKLPQEFRDQGGQIVSDAGARLVSDTQNGYPVRQTNLHPGPNRKSRWYPPGNLHSRVATVTSQTTSGALATVKSSAPHAWWFEHKTNVRQTASGANRGAMPERAASQRMIPKAIRIRKAMYVSIVDMVKAAGFEVSVD
jgi:hypothetical protein